jgi:hypothetical protein
MILGTMLVAATTALTGSVQAQAVLVGEPVTALGLAREIHSLAEVLPRTAGDGLPAATGADVALLEDLDGASFSPPIDAETDTIATASGWTQQVAIDSVDLSSPQSLAADPTSDATLLRLTVTVRQGARVVGNYVWWLNP